MKWFLGTMGFAYKDWQDGVFYPAGMPKHAFLSHYSQFFNAVEMDNTFYGIPKVAQVKRWAANVPDEGFLFSPKTPREITHELRLRDATELMAAFLSAVRHFGSKLGPILIQLPPETTAEDRPVLADFLSTLPTDLRYAVEFRHRSWHATATGELLQTQRVAWVSAEYQYMPRRIYKTTDFIYIRWLGRHGTFEAKTHERIDRTERLQEWYADAQQRADGVEAVYGFFNNDFSGFSPATCNHMMQIVGKETKELRPIRQQRLL